MEINLAAIIFLRKTQFTGRRFRHRITLIIVVVSDDMNANFNISLGPLYSLSPGRIVGVLLLNWFDSPQKTNMSGYTTCATYTIVISKPPRCTRLARKTPHSCLRMWDIWSWMDEKNLVTSEMWGQKRIWYTLTYTNVHRDRKAVRKKRCKIEKGNFNWGFCVHDSVAPSNNWHTHTHNHVYKRGGIIGNIIDTSRPLTHTGALQKQALDTLTQHSQTPRAHLYCCASLFNFARQQALRG